MEGPPGRPAHPLPGRGAKNRLARKMARSSRTTAKLLVYRSQLVNGLFAEMEEALEEYTGPPCPARGGRAGQACTGNFRQCTVRLRRADEALLAPVVKRPCPRRISWTVPSVWAASSWKHSISCTTKRWIFAAAAERAAF